MKPASFVLSTNSYNYKCKKIAPEAPEGDIGAFFYIYFTFLSQISFNSMILHSFMEISKSISRQHSTTILPDVIVSWMLTWHSAAQSATTSRCAW